MSMWLRVFAATDGVPDPAALADCLGGAAADFVGDDTGWYSAAIRHGQGSPVTLERFHAEEDGFRAEMNGWAAYLETLDYSPNHVDLMRRAVQARQLFTLRKPIDHGDEAGVDRLCLALARRLAALTGGFYQIDAKGFFEADGVLLVVEY